MEDNIQVQDETWGGDFALSLEQHREKAARMLKGHHRRVEEIETELAVAIGRLSAEFQQDSQLGPQAAQESQAEVEARTQQLAGLHADLNNRLAQWQEMQQQAAAQQNAWLAELKAGQQEFSRQQAALQKEQAEQAAQSLRLETLQQELLRRQEELNTRETEQRTAQQELAAREEAALQAESRIEKQRREAGRLLRAQRRRQTAQLQQQRQELERISSAEDSHLRRELSDVQAKCQRLHDDLAARQQQVEQGAHSLSAAQRDSDRLRDQLEQSLADGKKSRAEIEELKQALMQAKEQATRREADISALQHELSVLQNAPPGDANSEKLEQELDALVRERNSLIEQLEEAARKSGSAKSAETEMLRQRFEMAVQDVRELKRANAQLEEELEAAKASSGRAPAAAAGNVAMDWESQKKRMLAQLESDFDEGNEKQAQDKLTVEGAVRITDQVVAEKEKEIAELKQMLNNQASSIGDVAVGAAAIAAVVDHDELIQQERENLKSLQKEWSEKLRQAEVDISVERAKLARERQQLEEKLRLVEAEQRESEEKPTDSSGKPRRKWLSRLGIKEDE